MIKAVILDFDDTVCMTEEACFHLENEVLARMGRDPMSREIHKETWGTQLQDAIKVRSPGVDVGRFWQILPNVHEEFVTNGHVDIVQDSHLEVLDELVKQGFQLMVLTSRTEQEVKHIVEESHPLSSRVLKVYHADETGVIKPDPAVFDSLLSEHKLEAQECLYVGDSPSDGIASKGKGMKFVATLESGVRTKSDFDGVETDAFIEHFSELPSAIRVIQAPNAGPA